MVRLIALLILGCTYVSSVFAHKVSASSLTSVTSLIKNVCCKKCSKGAHRWTLPLTPPWSSLRIENSLIKTINVVTDGSFSDASIYFSLISNQSHTPHRSSNLPKDDINLVFFLAIDPFGSSYCFWSAYMWPPLPSVFYFLEFWNAFQDISVLKKGTQKFPTLPGCLYIFNVSCFVFCILFIVIYSAANTTQEY